MPREIESKFFISLEGLERSVNLSTLPRQKISQSFIPPEALHRALKLLQENEILCDLPNILPFPVSYARVRRVKDAEGKHYFFTIKGPKNEACERAELEVRISKKLYRELLPLATDGTIKKLRYIMKGSIKSDYGRLVRLKRGAEIDILTHVGRGREFRKLAAAEVDFALVDLEFRSKIERGLFQNRPHNFEFLIKRAIEIPPKGTREGRHLAMRYLAKYGFDRRVERALNVLFSLYRKDREKLRAAA